MARSSDEIKKIDKFIGERLYNFRLKAGMSRQRLSEIVGISHQQTHKYEIGVNRISASRMFLIANALGIKPEIFYEGLAEYLASNTNNNLHNYKNNSDNDHSHNHHHHHNTSLCSSNITDLADTRCLETNLSSPKFKEQSQDKVLTSKKLLKLRRRRNLRLHDDTDKNDASREESLNLECA